MKTNTLDDALQVENAVLKSRVSELEALVKYYEEQFRLAKHRQFGASSEKSGYDGQLSLFNEAEVTADANVPEPELGEVKAYYRKKKRTLADNLPEDVPVEIVEYFLPEDEQVCPICDNNMHIVSSKTRQELKLVPAQASIIEHVSHVYCCGNCTQKGIDVPLIESPMGLPVIKGSFASPEAVAHIATQKFVMGVPLYRQEQEWERGDVKLSRQTMSNWLIRVAEDWLKPLYDRLRELLLGQRALHADETTLQVLREPGKTSQSKSYMWLYRTSGDSENSVVLFDYQPDRKRERPQAFLSGFTGYLHADGFAGYHKLPSEIVVVGCWSHLRRKFDEALKILPEKDREGSFALHGKRCCDKLFDLERKFSGLASEERLEERLEMSWPLVKEFFAWAESLGALPKSPLGKAIHYALSQRKYLERYLLDGRLEISNNRAERSIKPFVIGRKNWLFANTPNGANASAVIYSIVETAKENGLNAYDYLVHIFRNAPNLELENHPENIDRLLPWNLPPDL